MRGKIALGKYSNLIKTAMPPTRLVTISELSEYTYHWRPKGTKDVGRNVHGYTEIALRRFPHLKPDPVADNHFLVIAHNGYDKSGLWSFDA
jgi:hypothetical protein